MLPTIDRERGEADECVVGHPSQPAPEGLVAEPDHQFGGLIGSPETIRRKLRAFEEAHIDQVILLNQAGKTSHRDICDSLKMFAEEVMPEFHGEEAAHQVWKQQVLAGEIALEELDTTPFDLYSHQNEDIVRLSPEQLKAIMAQKEAERAAAGDD